jgi:hypothetical protein
MQAFTQHAYLLPQLLLCLSIDADTLHPRKLHLIVKKAIDEAIKLRAAPALEH